MRRRSICGLVIVMAAMLALAAPALAGGWAVVTLDWLPKEVRAGQALQLGFMVRQHGQTPINNVEPYLSATNKETGDTIRINARQDGPVGHFVVDVAFPSAGTWEWEIVPAPFEGTKFVPLTVLPALAKPAEQPAIGAQEATNPALAVTPIGEPATLRWIGALLLIAAGGLALAGQRATLGRWFAARSR
jgi:hypothetical protein